MFGNYIFLNLFIRIKFNIYYNLIDSITALGINDFLFFIYINYKL